MRFYQPFLRRRVFSKRVASVCGMIVVLPLLGCGSPNSAFDDDRPSRDLSLASRGGKAKAPRAVLASEGSPKAYMAAGAVKPKTDVVQTYSHQVASAPLITGSIQRTSLAPLAGSGEQSANAETLSGGYALGAVEYPAAETGARAHIREANGYGRGKQQPYVREESDYAPPAKAPRGAYEPEVLYPKAQRGEDGSYIVQRGDTLYAIAERHGLSLDELTALNELKGEEIYPGQSLRVESGPPARQARPYREARPEPRIEREPRFEPRAEREARPEPRIEREPRAEREARIDSRAEREDRFYREPAEERAGPYRERASEGRGDYRPVPQANIYERRQDDGRHEPRYQDADRYEPQPRRIPERAYREERPSPRERERERVYEEPRRQARASDAPDYTASNNKYTPDGPFEPSTDAPWRGESEWRRMNQRSARPEGGYAPPQEPRYDGRPVPAEVYEQRAPAPYQPRPAARQPYGERETYAAPPRGGNPGAQAYTVKRGDTLYEIARRNGLDQRELAEFNGLPADARLIAGQDLRIPAGRGYEWGRPRPEAALQAPIAAPTPAPTRQRAPLQASRAAGKEVKTAATPEQLKPAPQRSAAKAAEPQPQPHQRAPEKVPAETVAEEAPPSRSAPDQPAQESAPAPASSESVDVAANAPSGGKLNAHAVSEQTGSRECEALLASPEARTAKTFRAPVQGMVIAKFGAQEDGSFNDGINFSVPKGTPVKAAENGVVAYAGDELPGFGNLVLIRHADGYVTAYAHNDELLVKKCDVVKRGQIISKAGATGKANSPQLHFELRKDSKPMDPDGQFSGT
jgi:murein DD-endopeptidase MepM/ murein hydrolase activator NlpD